MPNIDIKVSADLQKLFELPPCSEIKLPAPKKLEITLPTGGSIKAIADISKGIPTDCSMTASLMLQITPLLASIDCLFKLLGLIGPLIDIVKGLGPPPDPIKLGGAIPKFLEAAEKVMPCVLVVSGAPLIPFLRDILCLILRVLNCLLGQLRSIVAIMSGLALRIESAKAAGNTELQQALECAQENAAISAQHLTNSFEPIGVVLELAAPLMDLAGVPTIQLPTIGSQTDIQSLQQILQTLQQVVGTIQSAVDALGGCPA